MAARSRGAEALALLGLARRAGALVLGTEGTRECLRQGTAHLVVLAEDGSGTQKRKLVPLAEGRGVPWLTIGTRADLGAAVGAGPLTAVAVSRHEFARMLLERMERG